LKPYYSHAGITIYHSAFTPIDGCTTVLADPMYGSNANTSGKTSRRGDRTFKGCSLEGKDWELVASDSEAFDPSPLLAYPEVVIWGANHFCSRLPDASKWIIWDKRGGGTSDDNADCELAWTNLSGPARLYSHLWRGWIRAGEENISRSGGKLHPFQKPIALMRFILSLSRTTGTVLVPYMGSGPELVAAKEVGRKAIGFEIEERFCEAAAKRLSQEVFDFTEVSA
jgi:site-specific DNA-methyltransferase (adenine-specific)